MNDLVHRDLSNRMAAAAAAAHANFETKENGRPANVFTIGAADPFAVTKAKGQQLTVSGKLPKNWRFSRYFFHDDDIKNWLVLALDIGALSVITSKGIPGPLSWADTRLDHIDSSAPYVLRESNEELDVTLILLSKVDANNFSGISFVGTDESRGCVLDKKTEPSTTYSGIHDGGLQAIRGFMMQNSPVVSSMMQGAKSSAAKMAQSLSQALVNPRQQIF